MDSFVQDHLASSQRFAGPRLPWETGVLGMIFGNVPILRPWGVDVRPNVSAWLGQMPPAAVELEPVASGSQPSGVFSQGAGVGPLEEDALRRGSLMMKWMLLVDEFGGSSEVVTAARADGTLHQSVHDILAPKADATLSARHGALRGYANWAAARGFSAWPVTEEVAYKYVNFMRTTGAAASRARSFVKALAMIRHAFGIASLDSILRSTRLKGSAWAQFACKRVTVGRDPFSVPQVRLLQTASMVSPDAVDKLLAGFASFLIATRLRFKDAQRCTSEPRLDLAPDGWGFVELRLGATKTTNRGELATSDKVAVGHAVGLDGAQWAAEWLKHRQVLGLAVAKDKCLVPAPNGAGGFHARRLRSEEFSAWLRAFLSKASCSRAGQKVGTHSGKTTLLSWCAKFGTDASTRRALGYHVKPKDRSVKVYSRDFQAGPLRRLHVVEEAVSKGEFLPDETRSGRFKRQREAEECGAKSDGLLILAKLYRKLHLRVAGKTSSVCGRAHVDKDAFEVFTAFSEELRVKTICLSCFPGETLESVAARF